VATGGGSDDDRRRRPLVTEQTLAVPMRVERLTDDRLGRTFFEVNAAVSPFDHAA